MAPVAYAQTQLSPLAESVPVIRSPRELMTATKWSPPTVNSDILEIRSPAMLNHAVVPPELVETLEVQKNSVDSIRVDSSVFNLDLNKQADIVEADADTVEVDTAFADQPESKQLQPLKFAENGSRLQPIKQPKQVNKSKTEIPPIVSPSDVATVGLTETANAPVTAKKIAALSETLETAFPKASLAFLRKPMDIADLTTVVKDDPVSEPSRIKPNTLLQPISTSAPVVEPAKEETIKPASLVNAPVYDFQTPLPTTQISLFVDGPDYLSVNQIGEYEIAVANSSSDTASVSSISLQVPRGVEIVAVEREAQVDDQKQTLIWSIGKIGTAKQQRIRFRVKSASARKVDFSVTVSQDGRESQTVSQTTIIR